MANKKSTKQKGKGGVPVKSVKTVDVENVVEPIEEPVVQVASTAGELKENKKTEKIDAKEKNAKKSKKKSKGGFKKGIKGIVSELKKVTWPTFGTVVKKTGVVLVVVACFTLVLFAFDYGLGLLFDLYTNAL